MSYNIVFSSLAILELQDAFDWYEERSAGLGERFVNYIDGAVNLIAANPEAYPAKRANYHEKVVDDFPFIIVYELYKQDYVVYILHVFHASRNPNLKY